MNLILLNKNELDSHGVAILVGRRAKHICEVIKPTVGDKLNAGIIDGDIGKVEVIAIAASDEADKEASVTLKLDSSTLLNSSPAAVDISLVIALPRPKVTRRIIGLCTECGVKDIHFINSYRVEKSFWQSPLLSDDKVHKQIILSLEQSKDTQLPRIHFHKRFKPFVEDQLPEIAKDKQALVAHPYDAKINLEASDYIRDSDDIEGSDDKFAELKKQPRIIAVGPEGGFIPYEIELLQQAGFDTLGLGPRIYRVETVIPLLLGKLA
jgi:16S rRNA (uracil1498-N3)-methyltransferase